MTTYEEGFVRLMKGRGYSVKAGFKVICSSKGKLDNVLSLCSKHKFAVNKQAFGPNTYVVTLKQPPQTSFNKTQKP